MEAKDKTQSRTPEDTIQCGVGGVMGLYTYQINCPGLGDQRPSANGIHCGPGGCASLERISYEFPSKVAPRSDQTSRAPL